MPQTTINSLSTNHSIFSGIDPRYYQLFVQTSLLLWGIFFLGFEVPSSHIIIAFSTGIVTQLLFTHYLNLPSNLLSTFNSTLSILLLLHADNWLWIALASFIAISSKFLIRFNKRHIFNPSNLGIVTVLLLTTSAWAAPGQWGQLLWLSLLIAGAGLIFFIGVSRLLTSISFLLVFSTLILVRALWLGDPLQMPLHQLQSGALLIFTFFMLSDPMTSPSSPLGRIIFGTWIGILSWGLQFIFYIPNAFLYALAASMPFVLILNQLLLPRSSVGKDTNTNLGKNIKEKPFQWTKYKTRRAP